MILDLTADWEEYWTREKAEEELRSFQFKGCGWYLSSRGEAILVSALDNHLSPLKSDRFRFSYWSNNPIATFNWIATAPVRDDRRGE